MMESARDLIAFPSGDNSSDTLIDGIHWNLTALSNWDYSYYSNGTFSNGSNCILVFRPHTPVLFPNGTFVNSTSCYSPINPMQTRSTIGILFACFFGLTLVLTSMNLRKHGRSFLPKEKRFVAVGRRWQWYWMFVVATSAFISNITSVDVDRYYLPEIPIVLASFFWLLMLPTTMCVVWESVRHWGSWQERQMIDPNPFQLKQDDRRSKIEFYLPLVFYFFAFTNFFMIVPRPWGALEKQRDPNQARLIAEPMATDARFKTAAFLLFCSWLTTVFSLWHSIKHYKACDRGVSNHIIGFIRYSSNKFLLALSLSLIMIGYEAACSFDFSISPLNLNSNLGFMYGLGWAPIALLFIVYEVAGYLEPNEDRELIRQRRVRGAQIDQELGIVKKPHWWSRLNRDNGQITIYDEIARNFNEVGGGPATARNVGRNIEMGNMPISKNLDVHKPSVNAAAVHTAVTLLFPARGDILETHETITDDPEPSRGRSPEDLRSRNGNDRSSSRNSAASGVTLGAKPQQIRSMLDL